MNNAKFVQNTAIVAIIGSILALVVFMGYMSDSTLLGSTEGFGLILRGTASLSFTMILAGLFGFWRSGAMDTDSGLAKAGIGLSVLGQILVIIFVFTRNDMLGIVSALLLGLGMLLNGMVVLQSNRWQSWRKFTPIACGVSPVFSIFLYPLAQSLAPQNPDHVLSGITTALILLFNIALWIEANQLSDTQVKLTA